MQLHARETLFEHAYQDRSCRAGRIHECASSGPNLRSFYRSYRDNEEKLLHFSDQPDIPEISSS